MVLVLHMSHKSGLMLIEISTYSTLVLEMLIIFSLFFQDLFVSSDAFSHITLVDMPRKYMLELTHFST